MVPLSPQSKRRYTVYTQDMPILYKVYMGWIKGAIPRVPPISTNFPMIFGMMNVLFYLFLSFRWWVLRYHVVDYWFRLRPLRRTKTMMIKIPQDDFCWNYPNLMTRWWFPIFFIFTPFWGRFPIWPIFFRWVEWNHQPDEILTMKIISIWLNMLQIWEVHAANLRGTLPRKIRRWKLKISENIWKNHLLLKRKRHLQ